MSISASEQTPNQTAATADFEFAALQEARNYRRALRRSFGGFLHGRVLEIGAGIGHMTREFQSLPGVTKVIAVEPELKFVEQLRAFLPEDSVVHGVARDVRPPTGWDGIVSINVLEHIEDDLGELVRYRNLLAERQGHLCLFVPARPELYAPLDRDFGHFRRYTRPDLRSKLVRAGFKVEHLRYYNLSGYFAWWFSFRLLGRRKFDAAAVRFFDRFLFPPTYWCESRLCAPPFGQNLIVVARAAG
ncbi:MAG: methyltransferase domain-containing protein [Opitutaceae bacterium]